MEYKVGLDLSNAPDTTVYTVSILKQIKTHRKKRINKKWGNMYGYVVVFEYSNSDKEE